MSKKYDGGVLWYTRGVAHVPVHFPQDDIKCGYCQFCRDDNMGRLWCRLTGHMLYSLETMPESCPIVFDVNEGGCIKDDES